LAGDTFQRARDDAHGAATRQRREARGRVSTVQCDVAIVGSGAGGGTVAAALAPLVASGLRVLVFEQGPKLRDDEFDGGELTMAPVLYEDGGGFLTVDGTMTLAFGRAYGGSTVVYTGTSLVAP